MIVIYRITNLVNGKTYIGQHHTDNIDDGYMGSGIHLKNAQKKYGIKHFKKEAILVSNEKQNIVDAQEKYYIFKERKLKGRKNVYNIADGGFGSSGVEPWNKGSTGLMTAWNKGIPCSEETKEKISESKKGSTGFWTGKVRTFSDEHKNNVSKANKKRLTGKPAIVKGTHWFNNGKISVMKEECPEGFKPGRLSFKGGR